MDVVLVAHKERPFLCWAVPTIISRILRVLSPEERKLFRDRIRQLDKKIQPGLLKLTWSSKGHTDLFLQDCRIQAGKVEALSSFHASTQLANLLRNSQESSNYFSIGLLSALIVRCLSAPLLYFFMSLYIPSSSLPLTSVVS